MRPSFSLISSAFSKYAAAAVDDDDRKFEPRGGTDGGWASRNDNMTWHGSQLVAQEAASDGLTTGHRPSLMTHLIEL